MQLRVPKTIISSSKKSYNIVINKVIDPNRTVYEYEMSIEYQYYDDIVIDNERVNKLFTNKESFIEYYELLMKYINNGEKVEDNLNNVLGIPMWEDRKYYRYFDMECFYLDISGRKYVISLK